jgi:hypothetical protein
MAGVAQHCRCGPSWHDAFPDQPVFTPTAFGTHWRELMQGFLRDAKALDALVTRYEDLVSGRTSLDELEAYLNMTIDRTVLKAKVGTSERGGEKARANALERCCLGAPSRRWPRRAS